MDKQCSYHGLMENEVPEFMVTDIEKRNRIPMATIRPLMRAFYVAALMGVLCLTPLQSFSQQNGQPSPSETAEATVLKEAMMCESIREGLPVNPGIVFSIRQGRIFCFTSFAPASQRTAIHHKWFHRGQLTNNQRLWVHPPLSTAASSIQLREADKGAWQVEVTNHSGKILKVLRFSVVD
ncbi:MAG: hypothetical protein CVU64_10895 [Deltaproteobacteria bacterium HGW-Deltaproteobacteria-21]|nr:MAG: hypothetical protein CVU64_10895 [Deltaproteobacteria bacterium HGW-Deltaproteobacteria-21]